MSLYYRFGLARSSVDNGSSVAIDWLKTHLCLADTGCVNSPVEAIAAICGHSLPGHEPVVEQLASIA